jgi:methylaspartate mutase epsilon subunit
MGVYPRSALGGELLLADAARLAVRTGARRLIVKTVAEAHRIPEVAENVSALKLAAATASRVHVDTTAPADTGVLAQARALVECVLNLHEDVGEALVVAFARGYLDVPFCLHPDNANRARSRLGRDGALRWAHVGAMPIEPDTATGPEVRLTAPGLLSALSFVRDGYDRRAQEITDQRPGGRP